MIHNFTNEENTTHRRSATCARLQPARGGGQFEESGILPPETTVLVSD